VPFSWLRYAAGWKKPRMPSQLLRETGSGIQVASVIAGRAGRFAEVVLKVAVAELDRDTCQA